MLILDENISEIEVWRLREWGIAVRQIGPDSGAFQPQQSLASAAPNIMLCVRPASAVRALG
jgi:hypothetical protein